MVIVDWAGINDLRAKAMFCSRLAEIATTKDEREEWQEAADKALAAWSNALDEVSRANSKQWRTIMFVYAILYGGIGLLLVAIVIRVLFL